MSIQHTAGPWFVAAQNDGLVIIDGRPSPAPYDGPIPKAHGPNVIATPNFRLPEHEANARLIAAAPDMLEALEAFVDGFDPDKEYDATDTAYVVFGEKAKIARSAIAKARGEVA